MTELLQTTAATPLANHLADFPGGPVAASAERVCYLGAATLRQLDAPEAETGALLFGAAVHDLGWLRRVAVRGEDRFRWLSGMATNAVETLADRTGAYNLVLNAQGRIQGDCYVWRDGSELEIEMSADQYEALMAHLDRFIVMDDVELVPLEGHSALGLSGPNAGSVLEKLGLAAPAAELSSAAGEFGPVPVRIFRQFGTAIPHFAIWAPDAAIPALWKAALVAGATAVGAESFEAVRIAEGIPAYGIDIQSRDLAQETGQMRAISFTKGCYLGQEIVERIRSRGQVHRHLRALELTPDRFSTIPPPGTELRVLNSDAEAKPAGNLTSVAALQLPGAARIFAIGMIRAEAEVSGHPLAFPGGTAKILHSPPKFTPA